MSRRLRVVHVIARMNVGGPAVLISSLARDIDSDEFDFTLITGNCADDEADYLHTQAPDVAAERIDGLGRSVRPWSDAAAVATLVRRFREIRPDIIHTHTAKAGVVGRAAAKLAGGGASVVHTYHGHLLHGYFSPAKTRGVVALERGLGRVTDRFVAVGPQVRDDLLAAGVGRPAQYVVIPPGLSLPPMPSRVAARASLGLDPARPVISMIGRLTGIKRPERFAEAVAIVAATHPDAQFVVAGAGDLESELQGLVSVGSLPVTMLGWRSDVETVLAASDALVLTSDNEGTPLSLIQAGLAGLPVVATDVGSVKDVVVDHETGLLCSPDAPAVAQALARLLDKPGLAQELGANARARANRLFSTAGMVAAHETLYRSLAHR